MHNEVWPIIWVLGVLILQSFSREVIPFVICCCCQMSALTLKAWSVFPNTESSLSMALMVSSVWRCNFARANHTFREYTKWLANGSKLGSSLEMTATSTAHCNQYRCSLQWIVISGLPITNSQAKFAHILWLSFPLRQSHYLEISLWHLQNGGSGQN